MHPKAEQFEETQVAENGPSNRSYNQDKQGIDEGSDIDIASGAENSHDSNGRDFSGKTRSAKQQEENKIEDKTEDYNTDTTDSSQDSGVNKPKKGDTFQSFVYGSEPTVFKLPEWQGAYNSDGTMITYFDSIGNETIHHSTPTKWLTGVSCDIYEGNTAEVTAQKYTLEPYMNSNRSVLVPYDFGGGYGNSDACHFIYTRINKYQQANNEQLVANGKRITDDINDGNMQIASHSNTVYYKYNFGSWWLKYVGDVPNTYPHF